MSARRSLSRVSFRDLPPTVQERLEGVLERVEDAWRELAHRIVQPIGSQHAGAA